MAKPLRVGVAGLGVVGGALARLLRRQRGDLAARDRPRHLDRRLQRALAARPRPRRSDGAPSSPTPSSWRRRADIDVFVELIGGADGAAFEAVKAALRARPAGRHRQQGDARGPRRSSSRARRSARRALAFEAAVGGGIPVIKTLRESARRQRRSSASAAFSTAPAITSCRGWRPRACRSTSASPRRSGSATPRPTRPSTSAASTPRTSSRSSPRSLSAPASTPARSRSRASRRSRSPTSPPPTNSASASSCSASPSAPRTASSSACIRRWSPSRSRWRRRWACSTRSRSTATPSAR